VGELLHRLGVGDVHLVGVGARAEQLDEFDGARGRDRVEVGDDDVGALLGEGESGGPADAGARPGDDDELVPELAAVLRALTGLDKVSALSRRVPSIALMIRGHCFASPSRHATRGPIGRWKTTMYQDASACLRERATAFGVGFFSPDRVHSAAWSREGPDIEV
jgi:hypothetical protein